MVRELRCFREGGGEREMGLGILAIFLSLLSHVKTEGPRLAYKIIYPPFTTCVGKMYCGKIAATFFFLVHSSVEQVNQQLY